VGASSYRTLEELPPSLQKILVGTFGEPGGDTHKANDLFKIVSDAWPQKIKAMPFIYMSCGTEDFLIQNNRDFLALLNQKRVPHEYREMPGSHDWKFWDDQVREFLAVASRVVKRSAIGSRPSAAGTHRKQLSTIGHQDEGLQNARCVGRLSQADPHTLFAYKGLS
jgi:hypothetical protein